MNGTLASDINDAGQIVGSYYDSSGVVHGFLYNGISYTTLDDPLGANGTQLNGINDAGQIVGIYRDSSFVWHAFVYSGGTYTTLDSNFPGSDQVFAYGNNDTGQIAGYYHNALGTHGFLATPSTDPPPVIDLAHSTVTGTVNELSLVTGSSTLDYANGANATTPSGVIAFSDPDTADRPTASIDTAHESVTYKGAAGQAYSLTSAQIAALEAGLSITPEAGNTNTGKTDWTYAVTDSTLDFVGVGETITVTAPILIDDHNGGTVTQNISVTINGANDNPIANPDYGTTQAGSSTSITGDVRTNDVDPDSHDTLRVTAISFETATVPVPQSNSTSISGALGTLTISADGNYSYTALQNKSGQDLFTYTVDDGHGGTDTSQLVITVQPAKITNNPSAGLQKAANIFQKYGTDGEIVVLAQLSEAAYHLLPVEHPGVGVNYYDPVSGPIYDAAYNFLPPGLRLLTTTDLPSLVPHNDASNPNFPTIGLVDGIYLDGNAAALVARSSDSLFIAFRGTNDDPNFLQDIAGALSGHGGTPDSNDFSVFGGMSHHYSEFQSLVTAVDQYLSAHSEISHVYVTGHSLGGAMAERFMSDHLSTAFQAVTFADPGYPLSGAGDDPRITNIAVLGDPVLSISQGVFPIHGDIYQVIDYDGSSGGGGILGFHDMTLYHDAVVFLSSQHDSIPQPGLITNGHQDLVKLFTNITYSGSQIDPWSVTLPTGIVPSPFAILPNFDPRVDRAAIPHELVDTTGGGTLTGGPGSDIFAFAPGFGQVTITNFHSGEDIIQFRSLFGNPGAVIHNTHDNALGQAVITYDATDTITLVGVSTAQLQVHPASYYFSIV